MTRISVSERITIIRAAVLARSFGDGLSPFEARLIGDVDDRARLFGSDVLVTDLEWQVINAAIAAMLVVRGRRKTTLIELAGLPADVTLGEAMAVFTGRPLGARFTHTPELIAAGQLGRALNDPAATRTHLHD